MGLYSTHSTDLEDISIHSGITIETQGKHLEKQEHVHVVPVAGKAIICSYIKVKTWKVSWTGTKTSRCRRRAFFMQFFFFFYCAASVSLQACDKCFLWHLSFLPDAPCNEYFSTIIIFAHKNACTQVVCTIKMISSSFFLFLDFFPYFMATTTTSLGAATHKT